MLRHYVDLELSLIPSTEGCYALEMRVEASDDQARRRFDPREAIVVELDAKFDELLLEAGLDMARYGELLTARVFPEDSSRGFFHAALDRARFLQVPLRFCLTIPRSAAALDRYCWETMREPHDPRKQPGPARSLAARTDIVFFRFLSSLDDRPIRPRVGELTALVAIADGTQAKPYRPGGRALAPIDRAGELARARLGLAGMRLVERAAPGDATLTAIVDRLRDGVDIFYLVCHGALLAGESILYLEDEAGAMVPVPGALLVENIRELPEQPRLIVLASCQSAGSGEDRRSADGGALVALGPQLAAAGIPAVIAMQGDVAMRTVAEFMPRFFEALRQDNGAIDMAMAIARSAIAARPDAHVPVLFTRLRVGRPWYRPGTQGGFEQWDSLLGNIENGECTPILGFGLLERRLGSTTRDLASDWAEQFNLPLSEHDRRELQRVAQYIADEKTPSFLRKLLSDRFRSRLNPPAPPDGIPPKPASFDPHALLARLPCRSYILATPDDLLLGALQAAGRQPQLHTCNWRTGVQSGGPPRTAVDDSGRPPVDRPLVCHLFGRLGEGRPAPLLSEEDYFDFLFGFGSEKTREYQLPVAATASLTDSGLLFLGFRLDDWSFRVLLHAIRRLESSRRDQFTNIAVQIDPSHEDISEPDLVRRYIDRHMKDVAVTIFWGTAEEFLVELERQWQRARSTPT